MSANTPGKATRYGHAHRRLRDQWRTIVDAGRATCVRCGRPLEPGQPFDLDHADDGVSYRGPACVACNRAAGARTRNGIRPRMGWPL